MSVSVSSRPRANDDAAAFELTIDSIGDIEQTVQEVSNLSDRSSVNS